MRYAITLLALATVAVTAPVRAADDDTAIEQQARELAAEYISRVKPVLKQSMTEGGPTRAIEVCAGVAPRIAEALSTESGWMVRRVSLKQRNPSRAVPDDWERAILQQFDQRQAGGASASELVHSETVGSEYRYMQAQVAEGICLTCHGTELPAAVKATLSEFYPDDAATGYLPGQVRGAISVRRMLP